MNRQLSERLLVIASLVTPGLRLADVGCDHGLLSLYLLGNQTVPYAIGMDLREGPLSRAQENAVREHLGDRIVFRLSDGLDAYEAGEADSLVIAGMGGQMMADILLREPEKTASFQELILEPQKDPDRVRAALRRLPFGITAERMVKEQGKYYPVIRAARSAPMASSGLGERIDDYYGPILLKNRDGVLKAFLDFREPALRRILDGLAAENAGKRRQFEQALEDIETIRRYFSCGCQS